MLIHASRTRSSVGLTCDPSGALIRRPRHRPATMRTSNGGTRDEGRGTRDGGLWSCRARPDVRDPRLEVTLSPVIVALQPERDINLCPRLKFCRAIGKSPTERVQRSRSGVKHQLETILAHDAWWSGDRSVPRQKDGRRISDPKRLEVAEQRFDPPVESLDADLEIDANLGDEIGGCQNRARHFIEPSGEVNHLVAGESY